MGVVLRPAKGNQFECDLLAHGVESDHGTSPGCKGTNQGQESQALLPVEARRQDVVGAAVGCNGHGADQGQTLNEAAQTGGPGWKRMCGRDARRRLACLKSLDFRASQQRGGATAMCRDGIEFVVQDLSVDVGIIGQ